MQTYIFYYNEAYEYLHMIDTIKGRLKYKEFHYEQKQIVHLTKNHFQYAIEMYIPVNIYDSLLEYYKHNQNVKLEIQKSTQSKAKLKNQKHIRTDICNYDDMKLYEASHKKTKDQNMKSFWEHSKKHKHISQKTYDDLYNVLNSK
jgi:hypothetical protein